MTEDVSIVGGGIIGVTTGVFLNLKGYNTRIYTRGIPYDDTGVHSLATNYAAASVMTAVAEIDNTARVKKVSDSFFAEIEPETRSVRRHDTFELYQDATVSEPEYADALRRYRTLNEYDGIVPSRDDGSPTDGYVHEVFFVEMPSYVPELLDVYRETGGEIERKEIHRGEIKDLGGDVVVNSTGYDNLFDDDNLVAMRGHLVNVDTGGRLRDENGEDFSYTYYIDDENFVYAYPRDDCLLLGGSEHMGDEVNGEWTGEETDDEINLDDETVPRRIIEVNRELIESKCGIDIRDYGMKGRFGYRPYRKNGIRIEKEDYAGKEVVHCYGHGGSGVTLSWYSANRVYNLISGSSGFEYGVLDDAPF